MLTLTGLRASSFRAMEEMLTIEVHVFKYKLVHVCGCKRKQAWIFYNV